MDEERVSVGNGGWVRHQDASAIVTFLRFKDYDGRLQPVDVFVAADGPILANDLGRVPLGRIEAWVNSEQIAEWVRDRLDLPAPLVREAATHLGTVHLPTEKRPANDHWVNSMLGSQIPRLGLKPAPKRPLRSKGKGTAPLPASPDDLRITEPSGRPYGEDFYREVVRVYEAAAQHDPHPNKRIADANRLPVTTVRGWVRTARTMGLMPKGRAGSVG